MDTLDRSRRVAIAAARDVAARARALAEGMEGLGRALDTLALEIPEEAQERERLREPSAGKVELWTAAEVASYLKTSRSWVYQATASGRLPSLRVGHPRRFDPVRIKAWATASAPRSAST
jgi:excisionase family DNA binding protein